MTEPDPDMLALATGIARFIASGDDKDLDGVFAREVTIIENFPPHIFRDVATWREAMRHHVHALGDMAFSFAPAVDFSVHGERAYFCIPVTWTGKLHGRRSTNSAANRSCCRSKTAPGASPPTPGPWWSCGFSN